MENIETENKSVVAMFDALFYTVTTTTAARLLQLNTNAFTLYNFYCYTAKLQSTIRGQYTNTIKANEKYCMAGLHWGRNTYHTAKNILLKENIIQDVIRKDEMGKVRGHYVLVFYLESTLPETHRVVEPEGGFQPTNTDNKNINTDKRDAPPLKNITPNIEDITKTSDYLVNVPTEDISEFSGKYGLSTKRIRWEAEKARDWLASKGKTQKDYKSYFRNWLKKIVEWEKPTEIEGSGYQNIKDWQREHPEEVARAERDRLAYAEKIEKFRKERLGK